jgi:hypothetical protein
VPGLPVLARHEVAGHVRARRVEALVGPDQDAGVDECQARMAVEQVSGPAERSRRPPRVVVAQRHVRRPYGPHADVARRAAPIAGKADDLRAGGRRRARAPVGRAVVDDDDVRALRQLGEACERAEQDVAPVARRDDDRDAQDASRRTSLKNVRSR